MTTSFEHDELLADIRLSIGQLNKEIYGIYGRVGCWADAIIFNKIYDLINCNKVADAYLVPEDGYGIVPIEIGKMEDGKWKDFLWDDRPIRVLRVGFDKSLYMINPKYSPLEIYMMEYFEKVLNNN